MASTHILATGKIVAGGDIEMAVAMPPVTMTKHAYIEYLCSITEDDEPAPDGTLQAAIDFAAELQELEDDMQDRAFWARGGW